MKRKILLPLVLLAGMTLVGCGGGNSGGGDSGKYAVEITNKTELQAEWYAGDASRDLKLTLTPEANPLKEWTDGNLTITSSRPSVVSLTGLGLNALAEGTATVTVKYHGKTDTVDLTVLHKQTTQERYGVDHAGTAEDPFTNEEACKVARAENYNNEDFYVGGTIASFYHAPGARTDGAVSWYYQPAETGGEKFEIYKCYKAGGTSSEYFLTDDDVWVNGYAIAHGKFTVYADADQAETNNAAVFVSCEGNKPQPRQTINATLAQVLTVGAALPDGADSYDYYVFDAFVTVKDGNNYFLTATKGEALVKEKSDEAHGGRDYYSNAFEIYSGAAIADKLLKNAKVTVTSIVKNYHGQVENLLALTADDVTVVEAGEPWSISYEDVTFAQGLEIVKGQEAGAKSEKNYRLSGIVTEIKTAYNAQYKNMSINIKAEGDESATPEVLYCYRIGVEDADLAAKVVVDAKVTVGGKFQKYVNDTTTTLEIVEGQILSVEEQGGGGGGEDIVPGTYTFDPATLIEDPDNYTGGSVKLTSQQVVPGLTVSVSATDGNSGKIYKSNDYGFQIRLYNSGSGKFVATVPAGYQITVAKAVYAPKGSNWWVEGTETDMQIAADGLTASIGSGDSLVYSATITFVAVA